MTGAGIAVRTAGQVAQIERSFNESPVQMFEKVLKRMKKVNINFKVTFIAFGMRAAIGLALNLLVRTEWCNGIDSVLTFIAGIGSLIDGFAGRRAVPYTAAFGKLTEQHQKVMGNHAK